MKRKNNPLGTHQNIEIDHKDVNLLKRFLTSSGRIKSRKYSGLTAAQQRRLAKAVKRARHLALLAFTK